MQFLGRIGYLSAHQVLDGVDGGMRTQKDLPMCPVELRNFMHCLIIPYGFDSASESRAGNM